MKSPYFYQNISRVFLLGLKYRLITWHIPPKIPVYTINNISALIKRSNFTLVFFKTACCANPGAVRNRAAFQDTYFDSSQIYQLTIMYHVVNTNHDIILNFLLQSLYKFF